LFWHVLAEITHINSKFPFWAAKTQRLMQTKKKAIAPKASVPALSGLYIVLPSVETEVNVKSLQIKDLVVSLAKQKSLLDIPERGQ
jgi:SUMO ligase MMS21 Smc5/6 complex component